MGNIQSFESLIYIVIVLGKILAEFEGPKLAGRVLVKL
jgi:hypothetical protein